MASFAQLDNDDIIVQVISVSNDVCGEPTLTFPDTCAAGRAFIANTLKLGGTWLQTSYSATFRGKYAGIGDLWNGTEFTTPEADDDSVA